MPVYLHMSWQGGVAEKMIDHTAQVWRASAECAKCEVEFVVVSWLRNPVRDAPGAQRVAAGSIPFHESGSESPFAVVGSLPPSVMCSAWPEAEAYHQPWLSLELRLSLPVS